MTGTPASDPPTAQESRRDATVRSAHPGRAGPAKPSRASVSCGALRLGLNLSTPELAASRWVEPAGLPVALEIALFAPGQWASASRAPNLALHYRGEYARGWLDPNGTTACFDLDAPGDTGPFGPNQAYHGAKEASFVVGLQEVTRRGGMMLHACAVRVDGRAWVVAGTSGAGKTTLAERFAVGRLGDEWTVLMPDAEAGWACWNWTQWRDRTPGEPLVTPLGGVLHLSTDRSTTRVRAMSPQEAAAALTTSAYWLPWHPRQLLLDLSLDVMRDCPQLWLDHCLETPQPVLEAALADSRRGER